MVEWVFGLIYVWNTYFTYLHVYLIILHTDIYTFIYTSSWHLYIFIGPVLVHTLLQIPHTNIHVCTVQQDTHVFTYILYKHTLTYILYLILWTAYIPYPSTRFEMSIYICTILVDTHFYTYCILTHTFTYTDIYYNTDIYMLLTKPVHIGPLTVIRIIYEWYNLIFCLRQGKLFCLNRLKSTRVKATDLNEREKRTESDP